MILVFRGKERNEKRYGSTTAQAPHEEDKNMNEIVCWTSSADRVYSSFV